MFRFQDNLPEVYINESRDFQLLSRLSDVLFSGIKYDIDSMVNILDATLTKDRMLQLMCTKIGFFPKIEIDAQVLKYIIASFPYIIKYKGSELGIKYAVNAILKAENNPEAVGEPLILISNNDVEDYKDHYTVYIYTTVSIYNRAALNEILKYVLPAGYTYKLLSYAKVADRAFNSNIFAQNDIITILKVNPLYAAQLRTSVSNPVGDIGDGATERAKKLASSYIGAFDTMEIATSTSIELNEENNPIEEMLSVKDESNSI